MPLIKFARKLAEAASESRQTAELETQGMEPEEEQELVRSPKGVSKHSYFLFRSFFSTTR